MMVRASMVMVKEPVLAVAVLLSVTRTVMAEEPAAVGVPVIVAVSPRSMRVRPAGREPEARAKELLPDPPEGVRVRE